jgi:hypothetical protein
MRGTIVHGLRYNSSIDMRLHGYTDSDWAWSAVDKKSTFECFFTLGSAMVSWCSRKQHFVALSTTEIEYIALSVVVHEVVWLCKILPDLFLHVLDSTVIHCDNQSYVKLSENPMFDDK